MDGQVERIQSHIRQKEGFIRREVPDTPQSRVTRERDCQECRES